MPSNPKEKRMRANMNRSERRRMNRRLSELMKRDRCSICGAGLPHNTKTFGGLNKRGEVALAGECCVDQMAHLHGAGFFTHRAYDFLEPRGQRRQRGRVKYSAEEIAAVITNSQVAIDETDRRLAGVERRGGVTHLSKVHMLDSAWKADDRAWFEANPWRSHRIRRPLEGENFPVTERPEHHSLVVVVRQVEPGSRIRTACCLRDGAPLPDDEALLHAVFDAVCQGQPISDLERMVSERQTARGDDGGAPL
jgi:hypothetical protein